MVDEDARARSVRRAENLQDRLEVVDAFEELHGDPSLGQVLAPHVLDELRVMASLDPDARPLGNLGSARRGSERTGVRDAPPRRAHLSPRRGLGGSGARRQRLNGAALKPKAGAEGKGATHASTILEFDEMNTARLLHTRHCTNPARGNVFEDHANLNVDGLRARASRSRPIAMRVVGENVAAVGV